MTELYINGYRVVLDGETVIVQTLQNNDIFKSLSDRQVSFTNSFRIHREPNLELFDNLGLVGHASTKPYEQMTARLVEDGIELFNDGVVSITKTDPEYYIINIRFKGGLFESLRNVKLSEIDFGAGAIEYGWNHNLSGITTITNIWENEENFGYTYPYTGEAEVTKMISLIYEKRLFEEMMAQTGKSYNAPFTSENNFSEYLIAPKQGLDLDFRQIEDTGLAEHDTTTDGTTSTTTKVPLTAGKKRIKIVASIEYEITPGSAGTMKLKVRNDSGSYTEYEITHSSGQGSLTVFHEAEITTDIDIQLESEFVGAGGYSLTSEMNATYTVYEVDALIAIDFSDLVPDMTQMEFLKEIINRYGIVVYLIDGVYEFKRMTDILTDRANAQDWSDNYQGEIETSYDPSSYAKTNFLKYTNDIQTGSLLVSNEHLEAEKTLFTSKYSYPETADLSPEYFEDVITDEDGTDLTTSREGQEIDLFIFGSQKTLDELDLTYLEDSTESLEESSTYISGAPVENIPTLTQDQNLSFSANIVDDSYTEIETMINSFELLTCNIYFTTIEFRDVDTSKLVYIRQKGAYYYINKISNWKKNTITKVELIKVP
jgi:hypothetical protein